jgi:hypothetical protein
MIKGLSEAAAVALSLVAVLDTAQAAVDLPDQCWPDCQAWAETQQCVNWFGPTWYYCGWNAGWTYCCGGE